MKGVILAGGIGSRLNPLTKITNKHLLAVYDQPMIYYPLQTLVTAGIGDILIVTGGNHAGDFLRLLGNGGEFGLNHLNYAYQEGEGGIAAALALAEYWVGGDRVCVMLGDNIVEKEVGPIVRGFERQEEGAKIVLKRVPDPGRFGVPVFNGRKLVAVEEKPRRPKSPYAVIGIYLYDRRVFDIIRTLRPSSRGELEISDVNNWYIERKLMSYEILKGWWTDAGTFESLHAAYNLVARNKMRRQKK